VLIACLLNGARLLKEVLYTNTHTSFAAMVWPYPRVTDDLNPPLDIQGAQMWGMGTAPNPAYSWWFGDTSPILRRLLDGLDASSSLPASSGEENQREGPGKTGIPTKGEFSGKDAPASSTKEMAPTGEDAPVGDDASKGPDAWVCLLPAPPSAADPYFCPPRPSQPSAIPSLRGGEHPAAIQKGL